MLNLLMKIKIFGKGNLTWFWSFWMKNWIILNSRSTTWYDISTIIGDEKSGISKSKNYSGKRSSQARANNLQSAKSRP